MVIVSSVRVVCTNTDIKYHVNGTSLPFLNVLTPNVNYSCRTAPLTSKVAFYTGCPRRNMPDFGRVFLMLKYTDITQNTYIQSWTVTEIMARQKWGFLRFQILQTSQLICHVTMLAALRGECSVHCACVTLCAVSHVTSPRGFLMYNACNPKDNYDMSASVFVVQFNGFMSLAS